MKTVRSMVLISNDPKSKANASQEVIAAFKLAIKNLELTDEVAVSTIPEIGTVRNLPLVVIFPEATVYDPGQARGRPSPGRRASLQRPRSSQSEGKRS